MNPNPKEIVRGVDYEELPSQQSRNVWASKQRGKPAVASTVKVVEKSVLPKVPSYHTRPASTNASTLSSEVTSDSTPSVATTTLNNSTLPPSTTVSVNQLIKNLQGQVDAHVLEKAMTLSGIPSSPSFSHLSEPTCELFEQEDPLWQEPIVTPPTNTPVPVLQVIWPLKVNCHSTMSKTKNRMLYKLCRSFWTTSQNQLLSETRGLLLIHRQLPLPPQLPQLLKTVTQPPLDLNHPQSLSRL